MKLIDIKLLKFLMVGVLNTILGLILMFLFYDWLKLGYWGSSSLSFILASVVSFFLNKSYTFNNKDPMLSSALKFALTIAVCYFLAYSLAKPLVALFLRQLNIGVLMSYSEKIAMVVGMGAFTILNYIGQRLFAFRRSSFSALP